MTACYTFYSYKGGSGRTTTLLNTTKHLIDKMGASPQKPILLVDSDLESAGLTYFFDCQDKFTDAFNGSIHTCKVLNSYDIVLDKRGAETVFGSANTLKKGLSAIARVLAPHFKNMDLVAVLGDISLPTIEYDIFQKIADVCSSYYENPLSVEADNLVISERYSKDLNSLMNALNRIANDESLQKEEKIALKSEKISDFLPAYQFVDVSRFFGKEKGTVKFLGVDVSYSGEQLVANTSVAAIKRLVLTCNKNNYCALLFDSGAGVQSSANALHKTSDAIVCCMRPSQQFISGTRLQLVTYEQVLLEKNELKGGSGKKSVIILPTAVPAPSEETKSLQDASFQAIKKIASDFSKVTDGSFCSIEKSVREVSLFKWREQILGVKDAHELSDEVRAISDLYASEETMPEDAKTAYDIYSAVAQKLIENT